MIWDQTVFRAGGIGYLRVLKGTKRWTVGQSLFADGTFLQSVMNVDFKAVCDAVHGAWEGNGESITDVAARFGISRGWIWKWIHPALGRENGRS